MRKTILLLVCISMAFCHVAIGQNNIVCRLGFTYFISVNDNWAKGKPVIDQVYPYSPAEQAGLKPYDVITMIDGIPIEQITYDEIPQVLNQAGQNEVEIAISNIGTERKLVKIRRECIPDNAIQEDQLAAAFSMYSLESTSERSFTAPFKTTVTPDPVDFSQFKTYSFSAIDENNRQLETAINNAISTELAKKGMQLNNSNPDMLIQTYYYYDKNPNYRGSNLVQIKKEPVYRFNVTRNQFVKLPFLNPATAEVEVEYLLQLGIRFVDQILVPGRILWESEANEMMSEPYALAEYAQINIPLMCMQYPYVTYTRNATYTVTQKAYNYTGISYNIDRLEEVVDVNRNAPAYAAGIRAGDIIERIENHRMNKSAEDFSASYKRFISNSMNLRDASTQFADVNGFDLCMFWDTFNYPKVAEAMQRNEYNAAFSYLYYFAPYVNPTGNNACTFVIRRGRERQEIVIRPTIRTELVIEVK